MTRKFLFLGAALCGLMFLPVAAQAQAQAQKDAKPDSVLKVKPEDKKPLAEDTPLQRWIAAENALIDKLSEKNKESFFILRNKHSIIRVIEVVKADIGNAVKSCGNKNPDIKVRMDKRFSEWKSAIDPILVDARKTLEREITGQKIVAEAEVRKILKMNDEAYEYGNKQVKKIPVTSKEACADLVDSMDRTEDEMVTLLQQTLLPESVIKQRGAKEDKAAKAQKEAQDEADKGKSSTPAPKKAE